LDFINHTITYCNAGHDAPISIFQNKISRLTEGGLLLGSFDFAEFEQVSKLIEPGELLLIYSDGVTEAMNNTNEEFGEEKLLSILKSNVNLSAKELIDKIVSEVKTHSSKVEQSDDITLMAIKRNN
jgi:phosphoserine phosphatase RsbU/P